MKAATTRFNQEARPDVTSYHQRVITFDNRGDDILKIAAVANPQAVLTLKDSRNYLFFPRTPVGKQAAKNDFGRLKERTTGRDKRISLQARWCTQPVLVANGDHDLLVASSQSADMARRLPNARLTIYPDSYQGFTDRQIPVAVHERRAGRS